MVDCTYYPSNNALAQYEDKTFATIHTCSSDYKYSIRNCWSYYTGGVEPDPIPYYPEYKFLRETHTGPNGEDRHMLARWYEKKHTTRANAAVIAIHGSSSLPDLWFADSAASVSWNATHYLKNGGTALYNAGFDVFAPHVAQVPKFYIPASRIARAYGDQPFDLDLRRILALFNHLKSEGYETIHFTGTSSGGLLSVMAARALASDPALGVSVSIEGWLPARAHIPGPDAYALYAWNWENVFPGETLDSFLDLPPRTYLSYGSCSTLPSPYAGLTNQYGEWYSLLPQDRVITYDGGHEWKMSVFQEALDRNGQI